MEYTEVVSANPSSSLEVSFRWSTELTHEEFTRSQARATGHRRSSRLRRQLIPCGPAST